MRNRPGATSLAELVLVAWLFALVMAAVAGFAGHQRRAGELQRDQLRLEEAVRTGALVVGEEFRHLTAADMLVDADSVRIRAFRGAGPVCHEEPGEVHVMYRGIRSPEPAKDSVLLIGGAGERVLALDGAGVSPVCGGSIRLRFTAPTGDPGPEDAGSPLVALVFETGAYSLYAGAIRYRRGQGGRQPLTEAVLRDMAWYGDGLAQGVRVAPDPDSLPRLPFRAVAFPVGSLNRDGAP